MPADLAQELLDSIVDQVQDIKALKACSLVARSLVVSSQRHLFRSLCLFQVVGAMIPQVRPRGSDHLTVLTSFENAFRLFTMSPHLGSYVRELYLGLIWLRDVDANLVERVLCMASKMTFLGIFSHAGPFDWNEIPPSVTCLLRNITHRPTVRARSFERFIHVPSSFILSPSLRALSLYNIEIIDDLTSTSLFIPTPRNASHLEDLVITVAPSYSTKSAMDMDMHGHLAGLRNLSLLDIYGMQDARFMSFLLDSVFYPALEHLELAFLWDIPVLSFPSLPALRSLEIGIEFDMDVPATSLPPTLFSALATIHTTAPLLERLSLTVKQWYSMGAWPQRSAPCPLFASLHFAKRLPRLRHLRCSLHTEGYAQTGFERHMGDKFPGPKEAGILTCSVV
ncbi:hypothetical protein C8R44DRAFT_868619 [Mycena epipterygia]|nr:hypothetical protein C8R44DRAFT_868619 [Mycena epipterygia]